MRIAVVASVLLITIVGCRRSVRDERYVVPSDFDGYIWVEYSVSTAPDLQLIERSYTITVPENGVVRTSSPLTAGRVQWTVEHPDGTRIRMLTPGETNSVLDGERLSEIFVCCAGTTVQGNRTYSHFYVGHGPVDGRPEPP